MVLSKFAVIALLILSILLLVSIWGLISVSVFYTTISEAYSGYNCVAQGKLSTSSDCVGTKEYAIGNYVVDTNTRLYCKDAESIHFSDLKGGDCEYYLYRGWVLGLLGDFYYITPK
jgi:hypothetical protein